MNENGHQRRHFEFDGYRLSPHERLFTRNGVRVSLTPKVMDLLIALVESGGELLTKEQLLTLVWADTFVEESNISRAVSTLRKTLGHRSNGSDFIETVPKTGYRFIAPVTEVSQDGKQGVPTRNGHGPLRPILLLSAASLVVAAFGVGFYLWKGDGRAQQNVAEAVRLTDDPANDLVPRWTSDGRIRFFRVGGDKQARSMLMNADGTGQGEAKDFSYGLWSPDGTKVVFAKPGDKTARYIANADGSNEIALPLIGNTDWSSDSKKIVYQLGPGQDDNSEIFVYTLETGKSENVTNHPAFDADPSFSPDGRQIVFASTRDGNAEVYTMSSDGTNVRRLTDHPAWDNHPVFSPDGTTIAFNSDRENENSDVYLMNTDGGGIRHLTDSKFNESVEPGCWSSDGTRIAFYSDRNGNDDIYVTSAEVFRPKLVLSDEKSGLQFSSYSPDGKQILVEAELSERSGELRIYDSESKQSRVLARTENADLQPVFFPDGSRIAFQNKIGSNTEICVIDVSGNGLTNLTQNTARDVCPSISPDGRTVAFATNRDGNTGLYHLYTMNIDGSGQQPIPIKEGLVLSPSWSPDGREIVLTKDIKGNGNAQIFRVDVEDPPVEDQLTFMTRWNGQPVISPDGRRLAFTSSADGNWEIYIMNMDGRGPFRLTRNAAEDVTPHWSPDSSRIMFSSDRGGKFAIYEIKIAEFEGE
jgi:Tol biopolymer transport system component/DNA-binding winged helix-turn-helix (wHTH) protein